MNEPRQASDTSLLRLIPSMKPCSYLDVGKNEILITAAGFEDRAFAAIRSTRNHGGEILLVDYRPIDSKNKLEELLQAVANKGFEPASKTTIEYDRFRPEIFPTNLSNLLKKKHVSTMILDISALSKLSILLCLHVCLEMNLKCIIFYAEAVDYGPRQDSYDTARDKKSLIRPSLSLYTGVHGVVRVSRLSSVAMQGQPAAAIAFMSFNEMLTQALLDSVYPSRLILLNGRPPTLQWREEATAWIHEQLRSEWGDDDNPVVNVEGSRQPLPMRSVSTLDYRETVRALLELYWMLTVDHRVICAPTGSKMQAVGCFIVKAIHPDIHIEYPTPEGFLDLYSTGIGAQWMLEFGKLRNLINRLRRVEIRSHLATQIEL